jgi:ribosomal protein S18 acetylase RimI-like enzyme
LLALNTKEDLEIDQTASFKGLRLVSGADSGIRVRSMSDVDLDRVLELRDVVRWSADPRAFDLLRGMRKARWAVAEAPNGSLAGMIGAVPLGRIGILCHLAVHDEYRSLGLGTRLSSWAVAYLRSRGARTIRLYATHQAESLYGSLGFRGTIARTIYRLDEVSSNARARDEADGHRVETLTMGDLPEIYGADHWTYGADRSALIFATLRLHPGQGLIARDASGQVKGYLIRSALGQATRIGPFVASTPDVARLLLARALGTDGGAPVEVTVPGPADSPPHGLLREFGFAGRADRMRMELGEQLCSCQAGLTHYGTTPYLAT